MKKLLNLFLFLLVAALQPVMAEEVRTVTFTTDNAVMEDNPKTGEYNITIFSLDGEWKLQLNYHSDHMFGTFGNEDFNLSGDGRYYNFARNPKNDMVFYSFTDMNVTVSDEGEQYRVSADCKAGSKIRFLVEATIAAPAPKEVRSDSLGYARVVANTFYGTYSIHAENDNYKLAYGIADTDVEGTFYRANLLMPELTDKKSGKAINVSTATAVHTREGDNLNMVIDIVSDELVQYHLTMFHGPHDVEVKQEKSITLTDCILQDLTQMYGCYQFAGQNSQYAVAIALNPDAVESGRTEWETSDIFMPYTTIVDLKTQEQAEIFDMKVQMLLDGDLVTVKAEALCMDGTLYHITMNFSLGGSVPEVTDTVNIDFGHAAMLDYTQGLGVIGVGAYVTDKYQIRFYLNTYWLEGVFGNEKFLLDACDIMVVEDGKFVFHDAKYVTATMEMDEENRTHITVDMIGVDGILYHATMYVDDLDCFYDGEYSLDSKEGVQMVGMELQSGTDEDKDYIIQFQSEDYVFSFPIVSRMGSIAGNYEFSLGNISSDRQVIYENGCEVRILPIAGTLDVEPVKEITLSNGTETYNTFIYNVSFGIVGLNNVIYSGKGSNYLLCIDEDGYWIEMDEADGLRAQLAQQGYKVRKVLKGGKIIIETPDGEYDLEGRKKEKAYPHTLPKGKGVIKSFPSREDLGEALNSE